MDVRETLRAARVRAGLTQSTLAGRAGTSQATVSAYENGRKQPSVETLSRLLAAAGSRLITEPGHVPVVQRSPAEHARNARILADVLSLAEALPFRREGELRYPRLPRAA